MSHDNFQPPEDPAHDEWVREQQAEAHWEKQLTEAYASGRKDEREEWLPVLEALKALYVAAPTSSECRDFHHSKSERHSSGEECAPREAYFAALRAARAAINKAEGSPL